MRVDKLRTSDGVEVEREVVEHPGSVVVLPLTRHGTVLLVRQWRHSIRGYLLEAPAGTRDRPGEAPEETAQRELREETGYRAGKIAPLPGFWIAPGWCDEYMYVFTATGLSRDPLPQDADEDVEVEEVALADVPALIRDGEIKDAKSIAALLCFLHLIDSEVASQPAGGKGERRISGRTKPDARGLA